MRVLHYLEFGDRLVRSGIRTATDHQRAALAAQDIELITTPWQPSHTGVFPPYDIAHINLFGPRSLAVAQHARRTQRPLVVHAHVTSEDFAGSFRGSRLVARPLRRYLRWFYSRADHVLCPSEYTQRVLAAYPVTAPVRVISNGVDHASLSGFEDFRREYRSRFDLAGLVVFAVGNVFERKGLTMFCRLAEATEYEFAWFGPYDTGPLASAAVRRWTRNPPANVTFTGWVEEKRGAFGAGDVFLFPTKTENQGIAVLEAMACGKPVVLRDIPVFREYYTDGKDCILCEDFEAFREALQRLANDLALRERLGRNARETARAHSLERVGDRLTTVYEDLIAQTEVTTS